MEYPIQLKYYLMNDILQIKNTSYPVKKNSIDMLEALMDINFHFPINNSAGIYKIVLYDGSYYIGKSNNIIKRIWEHLCLTMNPKHNKKFYTHLKRNIKNKKEIYVLKLSNDINKEYEFLDMHLNMDKNICYNIVRNKR